MERDIYFEEAFFQYFKEYRDIIKNYKIGYDCKMKIDEIADAIEELIYNPQKRGEMGKNNRLLAHERFDRAKTCPFIINKIEELLN